MAEQADIISDFDQFERVEQYQIIASLLTVKSGWTVTAQDVMNAAQGDSAKFIEMKAAADEMAIEISSRRNSREIDITDSNEINLPEQREEVGLAGRIATAQTVDLDFKL